MNIEEHIRRAMEAGQFDNLPGKGKPLKMDENAFEDPEWHMANKILRDAGFSLPWIENRKEIEKDREAARADLRRAWNRRHGNQAVRRSNPSMEAEWQRAKTAFQEKIADLNRRIFSYNLEVPSSRFQCLPINVEQELAKCATEESQAELLG
jgi:DnaJ family protein C protein 28